MGGLWPDVRSGYSSRSPCPYGGWSQIWYPRPSAKLTTKADSGLPSSCHESCVLVLTMCLLTWLRPYLSPRQPCVIMSLHLHSPGTLCPPLLPNLAAVGLWVDLAHAGRASSDQACASRPHGAAQTCLPGFFHTKHVSQGSNRSDEMGVQCSHPTLRCPHGTISKQRLLPTGAGP